MYTFEASAWRFHKPCAQQWEEMDFGLHSAHFVIDETFALNTILFPKLEVCYVQSGLHCTDHLPKL
jgi:hypothetical protein